MRELREELGLLVVREVLVVSGDVKLEASESGSSENLSGKNEADEIGNVEVTMMLLTRLPLWNPWTVQRVPAEGILGDEGV